MKTNQKGFSAVEVTSALVIVGLLVAAGLFVYDKQKSDTQTNAKNTSQQQAKEDFMYTGVSVPSDWKTYENEEYGFSFQYPADFSISESRFSAGESGDNAIFVAMASTPIERGVGGYEVRVLKLSLDDAVKNDALNLNDNLYKDTISERDIFKSGHKAVELSYVPDGLKVSWFFVEKDGSTVLRFASVEDSGVNAEESKAIYNSLTVK